MERRRPIEYNITESGCWECTSHAPNGDGYPTIRHPEERTTVTIYRYKYEEAYGVQPPETVLRHKCDNRLCINIDHIEPGTHADNVRDRVERGRSATGTDNGRAKLKEPQALDIYRRRGESVTKLAREYGVSRRAITLIWARKNWRRLTTHLDKDSA